MGTSSASPAVTASHYGTHKSFLLTNYILLGAASSCVFLTLSLRLIPSPCGGLLILLHALTIGAAVFGCTTATSSAPSGQWHGAHMVWTVLAAIFQGATAVLVFTRPYEFLVMGLRSYVRVEDGVVILRMVGGLGVVIFCLEWVVLVLAFVLRYHAFLEGGGGGDGGVSVMRRSAKVQCGQEEEMKDWPWPFQV